MKIGKINNFYLISAIIIIGLFGINSRFFKGGKSQLGITYSREFKINTEKASTVKKIHVVPGQTIQKGDLLVELTSNNLDFEIKKSKNQLRAYQSEKTEKDKVLGSEVKYLEAQKGLINSEINAEVNQITKELDLNREITRDLAVTHNQEDESDSPLMLKIQALKEKKQLELKSIDLKITELKQKHEFAQNLLISRIELLQKEIELFEIEQNNLIKYASFSGIVENVYVKTGEELEAFTAILSIQPVNPVSVVGYIVGKKDRKFQIGEKLEVRSYDRREITTGGSITGFGSVVELPPILQKSTTIKAFGREIFIQIPDENNFATGEKVIIK